MLPFNQYLLSCETENHRNSTSALFVFQTLIKSENVFHGITWRCFNFHATFSHFILAKWALGLCFECSEWYFTPCSFLFFRFQSAGDRRRRVFAPLAQINAKQSRSKSSPKKDAAPTKWWSVCFEASRFFFLFSLSSVFLSFATAGEFENQIIAYNLLEPLLCACAIFTHKRGVCRENGWPGIQSGIQYSNTNFRWDEHFLRSVGIKSSDNTNFLCSYAQNYHHFQRKVQTQTFEVSKASLFWL